MSAPIRLSRRKRSSIAGMTTLIKPGVYGVQKPVQFAPNVTPGTYVAPEDEELDLAMLSKEEQDASSQPLFPPSSEPAPASSRRRVPPHKRRSLGYIPRPPNAFMLFRADFVRQRHVPGTIETNHGSLSKIIGNVWNELPQDERKVWEHRAKIEKAAHKAKYPDYRFRPVHNKNKKKQKAAAAEAAAATSLVSPSSGLASPADSSAEAARCEEISALLMTGKKGAELAAAVAQLDLQRQHHHHQQFFATNVAQPSPSYPNQQFLAPTQFGRRSSSVPIPFYTGNQGFYDMQSVYGGAGGGASQHHNTGIALPSLDTQFFTAADGSSSSSNSPSPSALSRPMSALALHQMQQMQYTSPPQTDSNLSNNTTFLQPWSLPFNTRMSISNPQMALGLGLRRASSTSAIQNVANNQHVQFGGFASMRNWEFNYGSGGGGGGGDDDASMGMGLQRDHSPLPDVTPSLFDPSFALGGSSAMSMSMSSGPLVDAGIRGPSPPPPYEAQFGGSPLEKQQQSSAAAGVLGHVHSRSHSQTHMEAIAPHEVLRTLDTSMHHYQPQPQHQIQQQQQQQQQQQIASASASPASLMSLPELDQYAWMTPVDHTGAVVVGGDAHVPTAATAVYNMVDQQYAQAVDEMWHWQGFTQGGDDGPGVLGMKGDGGIPFEALFQTDGSFNPSAVEIDAYIV